MRWSKLQRDLYNLIRPESGFQIHCVAYRMPGSRSTSPQIPRYWITVGKEIIWSYPDGDWTPEQKHGMWKHIPAISDLIREYINTSRHELKTKVFDSDIYGLTDILKRYDRRINMEKDSE